MKIKYLASSTVILESGGKKILCDPWLTDGEYYGTWFHYPPLNVDWDEVNSCDAIYVSHIHPDHVSKETFKKIDKDIPVYILKFSSPYLRLLIESMGFKVIEMENGVRSNIVGRFWMEIYAADNCNPEKCFKFFGCGSAEDKYKNTSIDTLSVIGDDHFKVLNINDCPYEIAKFALDDLLAKHPEIDLLLVGHAGASSSPQCFVLSKEAMRERGIEKKKFHLDKGYKFLKQIKPKNFMPFAGKYTLGGRKWYLEQDKWTASQKDALDFFGLFFEGGFALNCNQEFDLRTRQASRLFAPDRPEDIHHYQHTVLSKIPYEFDSDSEPTLEQFQEVVPKAFARMNQKRRDLAFRSKTKCYIKLGLGSYVKISYDEEKYEYVEAIDRSEPFISFSVEPKLLYRILRGPKYAHWNNAEIGSLILFERVPDIYERGLHYIMNFFHT